MSRAYLTPREHEILCHLAWGGRTAGIAHRLGIDDETVRWAVSKILRKLGARNRTHAVALAYRAGVLGPADLAGWARGPGYPSRSARGY